MERNLRKTRVGTVVSDKMDKTIVVAVKDSVQHPLYKKILKRTVKFKAHDEKNECRVGSYKRRNKPDTLKRRIWQWFRCKRISKWPTTPVPRS